MGFNIGKYYEDLFTSMLSTNTRLKVGRNFHEQVSKIDTLLKNDVTGMVGTIIDFMVQSACVPIKFESKNSTLNKIFEKWAEDLNSNVNIGIPRGFRALSEQYFRERWKSSFIVLNIAWGKIDGYTMPVNMWFSNGGKVYVDHQDDNLTTTKYYLGPKREKPSNELISDLKKSVLVRKPYNFWYDKYPTPYLVKKGALYHALFQELIIDKQAQGINQVFPAMLAIKMGCDEAMRRGEMPTPEDMEEMKKKFIDLKTNTEDRTANNGLVGAFSHDTNFENLLPDFNKILDEKITNGTDRKLLMALGLIEFKGFSTNREEAVLNPKPLVSEIEDAVEDYVELIDDVIYEIRKKNADSNRKFSAKDVSVAHDPIKTLLTDNMKNLIRSLYDRGLISKQDTVEGTTAYKFEQQVEKRKRELKDNLDEIMEAPVILNQDNKSTPDNRNNSDSNLEQTPAKKKSEADVTAKIEDLTVTQKQVFMNAYNRCLVACESLECDDGFKYNTSLEFADTALKNYLEKSYKKNSELPEEIQAMDSKSQMSFRKTFNKALKEGYTLGEAFTEANKILGV